VPLLAWHSGKRSFPECQRRGTQGRGHLPRVLEHGTRARLFFYFLANGYVQCCRQMQHFSFSCALLPGVLHSGKMAFPKCHALLGTRGSLHSPSAILPRAQHSGMIGFPECPIFRTRGSVWHSGNSASPVVADAKQKHMFKENQ
jgi:hypothetical protein